MERWASFDCYGTLIDWDGGVRRELARVFGDDSVEAKFAEYHRIEPQLEEDGELTYRQVMTEAMRALGAPAGEEYGMADALPGWTAHPEVPEKLQELRRRGWKLAILSNTDDDFIAASQAQLGMVFDEVVVAQEIGSYKPAHKHWDEFFHRTRAPREGHVHVAASYFHDIVPCTELGLRSVWINRTGETPSGTARPDRELPDLNDLPDTLSGL